MRSVNIRRVIKTGFINFWRSGVVSFASVLVMTITLFIIGSLIIGGAALDSALSLVKDRVDVNIYFRTDAKDEDINNLKTALMALSEVRSITYTSREQALADFKERHKDNSLITSSLDEIGDNPLGASLSVKAKEPSQYESIARFLESDQSLVVAGVNIVDKINFYQNKMIIDRLAKIVKSAENLGFAITLLFVAIVILVTFNTIRLAIFIAKEEIAIMRLVGASNWYIRGPFVITGIIYGFVGALLATIVMYPTTSWLGQATENFFGGINVSNYYLQNFFQIFLILLVSGMALGAVSSFLAVRKYLRV
ncbi:MAG: ABC transporter permease [Candidatus Vogelbacteria bacterium]|nr:ABC transporter permease [Candidatus Vogelbacteria bacterium]